MKHIRLTNEDIGALCLSLAHLSHAGIGAGDAFAMLAEDERDRVCRDLLVAMSRKADEGMPLAENFRQTECFPAYVCGLLEVGERVGKVEETLRALAHYYDGRARMDRRLRSALLYPSVLLVVLLAVVVVLLVWVLPVFNDVYAQLGSRLTGVAGGLLALGSILRKIMPVLCVVLGVLVLVVVLVTALPALRESLTAFWRKKQGDKGVSKKINEARFAQALSMALSSGLTTEEAVALAAALSEGAPAFGVRCEICRKGIEAGESLPNALRESGLLPRTECRLLEAGVRGGSSESVMEQIAARLMEESEEALEVQVGRIEPTLVVVMSVLVGVILLSVMLPLMHIMTSIG